MTCSPGRLDKAMHMLDKAEDASQLDLLTAKAIMQVYHEHWLGRHSYHTTGIEKEITIQLGDKSLPPLAGRVDIEARDLNTSQDCIIDHKTSSQSLDSQSYWDALGQDPQVLAYAAAFPTHEIIWDVIKKPTIRPRSLGKAALNELKETRSYFVREDVDEVVIGEALATGQECPRLFAYRLTAEYRSNPSKYFARRNITPSVFAVARFIKGFDQVRRDQAEAIHARDRIYRNGYACTGKYGACPFLRVCNGDEQLESSRFEDKLPTMDGEYLSVSGYNDWNTCRQKWAYKYLQRKQAAKRSHALGFGSLLHKGLEGWWSDEN